MKEFPLIRSGKAALICALLLAVPVLLLSLSPATGLYALMLIIFLMPAGCCVAALTGGMAPAAMGIAASVFACYRFAGVPGMVCACLFLIPVFCLFLLMHGQKLPFFKCCAILVAAHMVSFGLVYLYLQQHFGPQLYRTAADAATAWLNSQPECDSLLYMVYQHGFIALNTEMKEQLQLILTAPAVPGAALLPPEIRHEMLLSLGAFVEDALFDITLFLFTLQSMVSGVACMLLPQRFGKLLYAKEKFLRPESEAPAPFPDLNMLPLSLWHLPRGIGWKVGAVWLVGSLLQSVDAASAVNIGGAILHHCATAIFIWQGAALMNFTQKARGTRRAFRIVLPLVLFVLGVLPYLGILDQLINLRGLRKPPEPKEDI